MRVIVHLTPGPNWIDGKSVYEQGEPMEAHLASMRRHYDEGSLLLGGPYEGHNGGIAVLEVNDLRHAAIIMNEDPGVVAGVLVYELRQHVSIFDAFAGVRTDVNVAQLHTATGDL
ncbi:MAG: hypothetical protein HKL85_09045 [Acidimicrobiaceae bacterium]|nr:hypothetical protein [Acidimicrobiaceae bacterium]